MKESELQRQMAGEIGLEFPGRLLQGDMIKLNLNDEQVIDGREFGAEGRV